MPFDATNFDYTKVTPQFTKDNPPKRMSEAIRMAVADVEALLARGFGYEWTTPNLFAVTIKHPDGACVTCTAGAVAARMYGYDQDNWLLWQQFGEEWDSILNSLSELTHAASTEKLSEARQYWPEGFGSEIGSDFDLPDLNEKGFDNWSKALLALADRLEAEGS